MSDESNGNTGVEQRPIILKLVRKKTKQPNGAIAQQLAVVDAITGRQVGGIIGAGVELFGGVMFLGVKVEVFEEETIELESAGIVIAPGDAIPPIGQMGKMNGKRF